MKLKRMFLMVSILLLVPLSAPPAGGDPLPHRVFAGEGVGFLWCDRGNERCLTSSPTSVKIFASESSELPVNKSRWASIAICDAHNSICTHDPWTIRGLECWGMRVEEANTTSGHRVTFYGGMWVHDGEWPARWWWAVKVVDEGSAQPDSIGMSKTRWNDPLSRRGPAPDDPGCGALDLATSPLIAGDFTFYRDR